jgi:cytoskeletal protein RodZ
LHPRLYFSHAAALAATTESQRMSSTPFGERLKREREMRGVSIEEIAAATRISTRFLEALESEQWDQLPGGVFNRGFIRSVARYLGMDEDKLVAEYAAETSDHQLPRVTLDDSGDATPKLWLRLVVVIVVLAALVAGGWLLWRRYGPPLTGLLHRKHATAKSALLCQAQRSILTASIVAVAGGSHQR